MVHSGGDGSVDHEDISTTGIAIELVEDNGIAILVPDDGTYFDMEDDAFCTYGRHRFDMTSSHHWCVRERSSSFRA